MKKTILIIEDDEDMQDFFRIILSKPDYEFLKAGNGQEALSIIDSGKRVDLILLDIVMPVMDGEEFFRILRTEKQLEIPVIYCSVDDSRAGLLQNIGPLQGIYVKGRQSQELKEIIEKNL